MNSINVIAPYKLKGQWVFSDPTKELVEEPFVSGADTIIEKFVENIPNANKGFLLLFAEIPFPGFQAMLEWQSRTATGNWYRETSTGMEGWLCPALLKYFPQAPKKIFAQFKAIYANEGN